MIAGARVLIIQGTGSLVSMFPSWRSPKPDRTRINESLQTVLARSPLTNHQAVRLWSSSRGLCIAKSLNFSISVSLCYLLELSCQTYAKEATTLEPVASWSRGFFRETYSLVQLVPRGRGLSSKKNRPQTRFGGLHVVRSDFANLRESPEKRGLRLT